MLSHIWLFCNPMDCSSPGSSVHEISEVGILERVGISFSRGYSQSRDWTCIFCTADRFFIAEQLGNPFFFKTMWYSTVYIYHIFFTSMDYFLNPSITYHVASSDPFSMLQSEGAANSQLWKCSWPLIWLFSASPVPSSTTFYLNFPVLPFDSGKCHTASGLGIS